jgi:hypothetical protein
MFKQLRDLFRRTDPAAEESLELSFDDLPGWLDAHEEGIEKELSDATAPPREAIHGILDHLREAVARMKTAEGDEEVHPRLQDISRKALPQFTKSMTQILSREPSGDPETFYATAAEILKGSLKALKGQGKYLSSFYPDEMKEVRVAVKDLGREVNTMNEPLARARDGRRQVEDVRKSHATLSRIREEYAAADGQGDEHVLCGFPHDVRHGAPLFVACGDVQKDDLVRARVAVIAGQLHRVARVPYIHKIDALDHTPVVDVQTGDDSFCVHVPLSFRVFQEIIVFQP